MVCAMVWCMLRTPGVSIWRGLRLSCLATAYGLGVDTVQIRGEGAPSAGQTVSPPEPNGRCHQANSASQRSGGLLTSNRSGRFPGPKRDWDCERLMELKRGGKSRSEESRNYIE